MARAALAPGARAPRRRARGLVVAGAGLLVLAAAAALALHRGGSPAPQAPRGSGIAVLEPSRSGYSAFIPSEVTPSSLAVGEGAVWALNTDDANVTRIDPRTRKIMGQFTALSTPAAVAAGAGAVWIGNSRFIDTDGANSIVSVSRVDPATMTITHTEKLPNADQGGNGFSVGLARIVVGDGAVWALASGGTVARIDPRAGAWCKSVETRGGLAAGPEGVWVLSDDGIARIDPATNRVGTRIPFPFGNARDIAVGGGAVWVTDGSARGAVADRPRAQPDREHDRRRRRRVLRRLRCGRGLGRQLRLRDRVARRPAHEPRHRTGPGRRRPVAGGRRRRRLGQHRGRDRDRDAPDAGVQPDRLGRPHAGCADRVRPDAAGPVVSASARADVDAIRLVLQQHGYRAGRFNVGYQSCDESTTQTGNFDPRRCAANANAYAHDTSLVALIGPWSSFCAEAALRTLNLAEGGPVPVISPISTDAGLTRTDGLPVAAGGNRGEPGFYYPTGVRNFVRLSAVDALEGTALAVLAKQLGLTHVYVLLEQEMFFEGQATEPFKRAANALGVGLAGESTFTTATVDAVALANAVARTHADGVVLGAHAFPAGVPLVKALRARLGPRVPLLATGNGFDPPLPAAARGVYVASTDVPRSAAPLTPAGERFAREAGEGNKPEYAVLESAQAAQLVLSAIARSDGTRASVLRNLRASRVTDGILGSFHFDRNGDIDPPVMPVERLAMTRRGAPIEGAVFDRLITIPEPLARP